MAVMKAAMANMLQLLLWRFEGILSGGGVPDAEETEALAAVRSAFSGQLDAIYASTELVISLPPALQTGAVTGTVHSWEWTPIHLDNSQF